MEGNNRTRTQSAVTESRENDSELELTIVMKVKLAKPEQTPQLPAQLEAAVEQSGLQYKRAVFQWLVEHADAELIANKEREVQFTRYDDKPYAFKTLFGAVAVKRARVMYDNGRTEIPSHHIWKTPHKAMITAGLRAAVCDLAIKTSIGNTQTVISQRTGERDLLSARTLLNILHSEGSALIEAQERRARAVYEAIPEAKIFQIDPAKTSRKRPPLLIEDEIEAGDFEGNYGIRAVWLWEAGKLSRCLPQHTQAEGLIIIQSDECIVPAQPGSKHKDIWVFTGVVNAGGRAYYFTAAAAAKLWYQIGALLGALGAHQGTRELLVLADGARWIRKWYRLLPAPRKKMRLCWYHLTQTCRDLLTAGFGYARGLALEGICLRHLWRGEVMAAVNIIEAREAEIINKPKIRRLIRYLKARLPIIPNYLLCRSQGEWIANTRVEVFNNWAVSSRCKRQGSSWSPAGVTAVAALTAAQRNAELEVWRQTGELPCWVINPSAPS